MVRPQLFLALRDRYTATLVEMLIASRRYKRVMAVLGLTQNEAVWQMLSREMIVRDGEFVPIL